MLDDDQALEVVRLYRGMWTIDEIADHFGVSIQSVRRVLDEHGVARHPPGRQGLQRADVDIEALVARYLAGASTLQLSRELGVDRKAIVRWLVDAGVEIDSRRRRSI